MINRNELFCVTWAIHINRACTFIKAFSYACNTNITIITFINICRKFIPLITIYVNVNSYTS